MTNICAAIGCAQMTRIHDVVDRKIELANRYRQRLKHIDGVVLHDCADKRYVHSHWMITVLVNAGARDGIMALMRAKGIETRPVFPPVHEMPMYRHVNAQPCGRRPQRQNQPAVLAADVDASGSCGGWPRVGVEL
jgi:perosamine synthetase